MFVIGVGVFTAASFARYVTTRPGDAVLVPAGVQHCFRALELSTLVVMGGPADAVDMVVELAEAGADLERFGEILARYDSDLLESSPHWSVAAKARG